MSEHKHTWKTVAHLDFCHWFEWRFACDCGATRRDSQERNFSDGWLGTGDFPDYEKCARCRELAEGAERNEPRTEVEE